MSQSRQPNIVYIHSHDTGRFIEPYGYSIHTPHLTQLARDGVLYRNAFCANPTCSPSRATLLTGEYPHSNGMLGLAHRGFSLNDYSKHIVTQLKAAGYRTALSGIQHVAAASDETKPWDRIGYDSYLGDHTTAETEAAKYLGSAANDDSDAPFFLSVGFVETHRAFPDEHPDYDDRFIGVPPGLPDVPEVRKDYAQYCQCATELDRKMGVVLEALDSNGFRGNTLVIATTDHGVAFPRHKCNLEDTGIGVFLMIRGPGFEAGTVDNRLVSQVDLYPTICDVVGMERPDRLQGLSILTPNHAREEVFAELNYHGAYEPARAIRTARYKYIRRLDYRTSPVLQNTDNGLTKSFWMSEGWGDRRPAPEALYDLSFDPLENRNLIDDSDYAEVLGEMMAGLDRWMEETDDPARAGEIPIPATATLNSRDDVGGKYDRLPPGTR